MKQGGKKIGTRLLGLILAGLLLGLLFNGGRVRAEGSGTETVDLQVTYSQEASREMLEYINLFRTGQDIDGEYTGYIDTDNVTQVMVTGLQPLEYDYNLEKVAMQRAAEIALSFSHTRPNGTGCYTALLEVEDAEGVQYHGLGENIAAGYSTALQTFRQWREDGEDYAYQGHRRNMLSNHYNGIGIGHVVVGGRHFWAQALGRTDDGHGTETAAAQGTRSVPVEIKTAYMTDVTAQAEPASVTVDVGVSRALPQAAITFQYSDPDNWPGGVVFSAKAHPSWTVKKTSVARIENGLLRGVAVGSTKLTATVYGSSVSASVVCENLGTPSVTTQPADASGYIDSNVTFSVEAAGRELTYKWEYKKTASSAWKTWSSNSGRTQTVAVTEARNGYLFRCRITDVYGNQVTSDEAKLTVKPKITAQPKAVSATVGAAAQFSVTATGAGLQYRWQFSKDEGETWKNVTDQNEGYNTSVLKLKVKAAWNGYCYRCVIRDANGLKRISHAAELTVK